MKFKDKELFKKNVTYLFSIAKRTGISGGIHKLRKTYASYLAMREGNLRKLQERLRHDDIDTTMIYAGITQEALHEGKNKINFFREGGG